MALITGLISVAIDVLLQKWRLRLVPSLAEIGSPLEGLTCIVTGPTSGIGKETAAALSSKQAIVVLACRSKAKGTALKAELEWQAQQEGRHPPQLEVAELDVASLQSINNFASQWGHRQLHVLVNNAGLFNLQGRHSKTVDGFEMHMGTNYLGPWLLSMLLLPALHKGAKSAPHFTPRLVMVASKMHELASSVDISKPAAQAKPQNALAAYNQSKLAQVMFAKELRRRLPASTRLAVFAADPGEALTNIVRGGLLAKAYQLLLKSILSTPAQGARSSVFCASAPEHLLGNVHAPQCSYVGSTCTVVPASKPSRRLDAATALWRWSADAVGLCGSMRLLQSD